MRDIEANGDIVMAATKLEEMAFPSEELIANYAAKLLRV